ncbi:hypothetical protein RTCIAT899_CH06685 [Rhizobium tropici CIAT 899]|nr:hypothetical protein RTCIAT899_CH06685 [Rhizobium tropici CIAT 899]
MAALGILWECGLHMIRNTSKSNEISATLKASSTRGDR